MLVRGGICRPARLTPLCISNFLLPFSHNNSLLDPYAVCRCRRSLLIVPASLRGAGTTPAQTVLVNMPNAARFAERILHVFEARQLRLQDDALVRDDPW